MYLIVNEKYKAINIVKSFHQWSDTALTAKFDASNIDNKRNLNINLSNTSYLKWMPKKKAW